MGGSWISTCQLHYIELWAYLRDLLCLLLSWSVSRILELTPAFWQQTLKSEELTSAWPPTSSAPSGSSIKLRLRNPSPRSGDDAVDRRLLGAEGPVGDGQMARVGLDVVVRMAAAAAT